MYIYLHCLNFTKELFDDTDIYSKLIKFFFFNKKNINHEIYYQKTIFSSIKRAVFREGELDFDLP